VQQTRCSAQSAAVTTAHAGSCHQPEAALMRQQQEQE
jgi:hypothetical protein